MISSRDRVLTALSHKEPDRVPLDFGAAMETTIHIKAYRNLKKHLHIAEEKPVREKLKTAQFAVVDTEVSSRIGSDARGVHPAVPPDHDYRYHE